MNIDSSLQAAVEVAALQRKHTEQTEVVTGACRVKLETMSAQVEAAKTAFEERLRMLTAQAKASDAELQARLADCKKAHATELAEAVRIGNAKYTEMLAQRMNKEDELSAALHKRGAEADELQKTIKSLQDGIETARVAAAASAKHCADLEAQLRRGDSDTAKQLTRLQAEIQALRAAEARNETSLAEQKSLVAQRDALLAECRQAADAAAARAIDDAKQAAAAADKLSKQLAAQANDLAAVRAQLAAAVEALATSQVRHVMALCYLFNVHCSIADVRMHFVPCLLAHRLIARPSSAHSALARPI